MQSDVVTNYEVTDDGCGLETVRDGEGGSTRHRVGGKIDRDEPAHDCTEMINEWC